MISFKEKERRRKIGLKLLGNQNSVGNHSSTEFKKGCVPWNKNLTVKDTRVKKWSESSAKTRRKLFKEGKLVVWNKNKKTGFLSKTPELTKKKLSESKQGEKHWNWKDGISKNREYKKKQYKEWVEENREKKYFINERRRIKKLNVGGSHTLQQWLDIKEEYNFTCLACKKREPFKNQSCQILTEDHIVPITKWDTWITSHSETNYLCDDIENIQPLCKSCNSKKNTKIINYKSKCKF